MQFLNQKRTFLAPTAPRRPRPACRLLVRPTTLAILAQPPFVGFLSGEIYLYPTARQIHLNPTQLQTTFRTNIPPNYS